MLPGLNVDARQLRQVLRSAFDAVSGLENPLALPEVTQCVVVLVDGLGLHNLRARSGHARNLMSRLTTKSTAESGFPTTTAAALASLTTGEPSGAHGLVGYTIRNPATGLLANQLTGWGVGMPAEGWLLRPTLFQQRPAIDSFAVGPARYATSGFSGAVLAGARYVGAKSVQDRFDAVAQLFASGTHAVAYVYIPELDSAGHARGWQSPEWTAALEEVDAAVGSFARSLKRSQGMLVTADHGMVDVPHTNHVVIEGTDPLLSGVRMIGGEPRGLQLYLEPGLDQQERDAILERWRDREAARSWVVSREEAVSASWFGSAPDQRALERVGDILIAARKTVAYYDGRDERAAGRTMIGQHGSWTDHERTVPLLRFGAFER